VLAAESQTILRWTLREIARLERSEQRPARLTEPGHERWHRVRRKLGWAAFIDLLHADLAESFPTAFALDRWASHPTATLDDDLAKSMIDDAIVPDSSDRIAFLRQVCSELGLVEGGSVTGLPRVQPHQRALELSSCAGRIAAYQVTNNNRLSFHENFTFVADTDAERVAIGIAAAEFRANVPKLITRAELKAERTKFDHVFAIEGDDSAKQLVAHIGNEIRWA
jgi:hypothetical protein